MTPGVKSLRSALRALHGAEIPTTALSLPEVKELLQDWRLWAREDQLPPEPLTWRNWLVLGGRGAGKTRAGAEWVRAKALGHWGAAAQRLAIIGPSLLEARLVMIEGPSGLLSVHTNEERPDYQPSKRLITWPNGSTAQLFSADEPETLRGPQFEACWCDELGKWKHADEAWAMLQFALRLGEHPQCVITTTPRPTVLLKKFLSDETTVVSRATTFANAANLAPAFMRDIEARYGGTRLGRQELMGELIEDDPNALFKREQIEKQRVKLAPTLKRIIVAVDPPAGFGKKSNACGLVVAGTDGNGNVYVLEDATVRGLRPAGWAKRAAKLFEDWKADRVVAEINQGGAMVEQVLREVNPDVSFKSVHASRGKSARAEPVAALYEQGRVFHVGSFPELEDEMCNEIKTGIHSPDRLDALVWAITELLLTKGPAEPRVRMV